jgi:hypothetical protein
MRNRTLWLVKDSDDVVNWCTCAESAAGTFPQADCPWCGCGWLFSCAFCRKCFTFARFEWFDESLESLAQRLARAQYGDRMAEDAAVEMARFMAWAAEGWNAGDRVVVIDWQLIGVGEEGPFEFDGAFAHHELEELPQVQELATPGVLEATLGSREYWIERELRDE